MKATICVTLKPDVLDPQGQAIQKACGSLGYEQIQDVRQGKFFEIELDASAVSGSEAAERLLAELSAKLLSNPVIENYRILSVGE